MDILFVSAYPLYTTHAGMRMLAYHLGRELSTRRHIVDLLAFSYQPEDHAELPRYRRHFRHIDLIPSPAQRPLRKRLQQGDLFPQRMEDAWSPTMWEALAQAVTDRHYDLVHLVGGIEVYEYFAALAGLPALISPLEGQSYLLGRQYQQTRNWFERLHLRTQRQLLKRYEEQIYQPYSAVVVNTQEEAQALHNLDSRLDIQVMPDGVNTDYFMPTGCEPSTPTLLFHGDFAQAPDLEAALYLAQSIYPGVKKTLPQASLYLVGANPPPELLRLASEQVQVTGPVLDLRPYFEQSTVYVAPYRRYAGLRQGLLQALAMMTPLVATPYSLAGLDLMPGEEVLPGQSTADLIQAVNQVLRNHSLRLRLQILGWQKVNSAYTWDAIAQRYEQLYQKLLARR